MGDEEAVGLSQILALQRQRSPLIGFKELREPVWFDAVSAMVEIIDLISYRRLIVPPP
jgi:hypothetical protein